MTALTDLQFVALCSLLVTAAVLGTAGVMRVRRNRRRFAEYRESYREHIDQ